MVDSTRLLATPRFHKSGRTDKGPKKPTLPQFVAKLEPTRSPLISAAKAADGLDKYDIETVLSLIQDKN